MINYRIHASILLTNNTIFIYLHSAIMTTLDWPASPLGLQRVPFFLPSPSYPFGQKQLKPPSKFWQLLVWLQGFEISHSSISEPQYNPSQKVSEYNLYMLIKQQANNDH